MFLNRSQRGDHTRCLGARLFPGPIFSVVGLALVASAACWRPAASQTLCTQPIVPTCVELATTYETEEEQRRCRQDVRQYGEEMQAFTHCLETEANDATKLARQVLDRFDCKLRKKPDCPPPPGPRSNL